MKRLLMIIVLSTGISAGPALADHEHGNLLSRENLGGAIGAAIGGLAGNKIVKGKGQPAATAAGAVGGFLLGKNIAHNYRGNTYAEPAYTTEYRPAAYYQPPRSYERTSGYKQHRGCCDQGNGYQHGVRPIHETYVARCTSNVRAGPGTQYHVIDQLHDWERVYVVGKVKGRNWYEVRVGHRHGYVYAPLLRPSHYAHSDGRERAGWYR